jgi:Tfp pilus assembly protein PilV
MRPASGKQAARGHARAQVARARVAVAQVTRAQVAGVTLLESVIAAVIIAIVALTMASAFMAISSTTLRGARMNAADQSNEYSIALDSAPSSSEPGSLSFSDGENSYSLQGELRTYGADDEAGFRTFVVTP